MKVPHALIPTIAVLAMFGLSVAAFSHVGVVSAAGPPTNAHQYPKVPGVDGSQGSIVSLDLDLGDRLQMAEKMAPVTLAVPTAMLITEHRQAINNRHWVQISGQYCKNKSGGDVFRADGAPVEAGLTC